MTVIIALLAAIALIDGANAAPTAEECEVPLSFLMNPANHQVHHKEFRGMMRTYYAMPYGDRYIWGATAGMLRMLYERIYLP